MGEKINGQFFFSGIGRGPFSAPFGTTSNALKPNWPNVGEHLVFSQKQSRQSEALLLSTECPCVQSSTVCANSCCSTPFFSILKLFVPFLFCIFSLLRSRMLSYFIADIAKRTEVERKDNSLGSVMKQ